MVQEELNVRVNVVLNWFEERRRLAPQPSR
jgi:hypothetical protein